MRRPSNNTLTTELKALYLGAFSFYSVLLFSYSLITAFFLKLPLFFNFDKAVFLI